MFFNKKITQTKKETKVLTAEEMMKVAGGKQMPSVNAMGGSGDLIFTSPDDFVFAGGSEVTPAFAENVSTVRAY
ncbi:hypothetical protein ACSI5G_004000 [Vibrio vulnificus]|nr:hypothetical protein [Vibrio vulnificus]HAS8118915.1 hypothetical protein [Vibrio vulnificus]